MNVEYIPSKLEVLELFKLETVLNSSRHYTSIKNHYAKEFAKYHFKNEYKPGSTEYKVQEDALAEINSHKTLLIDAKELTIYHSYKEVKYSLCHYTTEEKMYSPEVDSYDTVKVDVYFLTTNTMWGHDLITDFSELMSNYKILGLLKDQFRDQLCTRYRSNLEWFGIKGDLQEHILKEMMYAYDHNNKDASFTKLLDIDEIWCEVNGLKFSIPLAQEAIDHLNSGEVFYDNNNRSIKYTEYDYPSYIAFYMKHSKA